MKTKLLFIVALSLFLSVSERIYAQNMCGMMGVENGWSSWKAATGVYFNGAITYNAINLTPSSPRFNLTGGNSLDGCTPGPNPGDPSQGIPAQGRTEEGFGVIGENHGTGIFKPHKKQRDGEDQVFPVGEKFIGCRQL